MLWIIAAISLINFLAILFYFFNLNNNYSQDLKRHEDLLTKISEYQDKYNSLKMNIENFEKNFREDSVLVKDSISKTALESRVELKDSIKDFKEELSVILKDLKETSTNSLKLTAESLTSHVRDLSKSQQEQLNNFSLSLKSFGDNNYKQLKDLDEASKQSLKEVRSSVESSVKNLQENNEKKLEEMRLTVDEKLQKTLESRLDSSFKQVSERLEKVHAGLGEMQNLATGVGDLKKVLTNVKTRGTWGEMQLGNLLEDIMAPDQYEANVAIKKKTQERVDFAVRLPGDKNTDEPVWLPIDAKFPQEDYQKLIEARDLSDPVSADTALKQLEARIKLEAKSISEKYIDPPQTTDFGLLFLPTEGLYAEVINIPGLVDGLQRNFRINIVGPTTLSAFLNSLQLGFRTLTLQKRTSDVWLLLSDIKKHFGAFSDLLVKAHEKVEQAGKVIEDAGKRSRTIETKLRRVQELPAGEVEAKIVSSLN
jgi:DNA recombination protein RmuC